MLAYNKDSVRFASQAAAGPRSRLASNSQALEAREDISSVARNEWIYWIESAKKVDTRTRRIERAIEDLSRGKRRPCCWPGCRHR
ncbi:YdeI/OmpD-associated family protein [Hyphomicrobium denitrificans]|uniref:YdeI/OmpD-associated family protein n=1 Tax=Hyphomicrobium denitrificans TaxID=53399 RepID=UPI003D77CC58